MSDPAANWYWNSEALLTEVRTLTVRTERPLQILDVTPQVSACVREAGLEAGIASVQALHTTAGLILNEQEPLLFEDLERMLERLAPRGLHYRHDELARRVPSPPPGERLNGHAHCRAALLGTTATLHVKGGALVLGRWQRLLLAELDGPQARSLSVALLGTAQADRGTSPTW